MYITFIILINERVLESYNSSVRKPLRLHYVTEIDKTQKLIDQERELLPAKDMVLTKNQKIIFDYIKILESKLVKQQERLGEFKLETRIKLVYLSLIIGGFASVMGCLNVFSPFLDGTLFIGSSENLVLNYQRAIFDGFELYSGLDGLYSMFSNEILLLIFWLHFLAIKQGIFCVCLFVII